MLKEGRMVNRVMKLAVHDDDGEIVLNPPIASSSAAGGELDRQIQLEREKREIIKMKFALHRQAEHEKLKCSYRLTERANMCGREIGGRRVFVTVLPQKLQWFRLLPY